MNDNYIEAQESVETDGRNADRERAYERQEAQEEPRENKYLVQEMMGEQFDKYFWNEKHAL